MFKKECVPSGRTYICLANKSSISPGSKSKVKSSVQRAIRTQLVTTYPLLAPHIDEIIPKKEQLDAMKMYITLMLGFSSLGTSCAEETHTLSTMKNTADRFERKTRQSDPLPHRLHTSLLPTHDRRPPSPPKTRTPFPNLLPQHPHRPRCDSLRALRRDAHGSWSYIRRRSPTFR